MICNGGFSGALVLGFVYGLGLDMERSWGSAFCRRCVCVRARVCVTVCVFFLMFVRRLVVRRPGRFQCPMYMILDREGGFVVVCVSRSSLFPVQWGLRARVASFADRRCGYQPCGGEILYG